MHSVDDLSSASFGIAASQRVASVMRFLTTLAALVISADSLDVRADRPNIVLVVLDDAGYSDLGVFGGEIETPNVDQLAKEGVQFSQFHVTPNCSSTRASLLTGMDHHRTGLGTHGVLAENQRGKPGYEGYLNERVATLPEVLRSAGYHTVMAGKWHLGGRDPKTWPAARGFDDCFALLNGGASHWEDNSPLLPSKPSWYVENGVRVDRLPSGFYSSDFYTDKLLAFLRARQNLDQPFFAFLSFTAPHNPLHATRELIAKYEGRYSDGWDALQLRRLRQLKSRGLIPVNVEPQPRPKWIPAWESLDEETRRNSARDIAIYAAMIDRVDQNVGRLMRALKQMEAYDDTLILLMSDNGPSKTTILDYLELDGVGGDFARQFNNDFANRGLPGSSVDLGPGWAYGLAAPFRLMKGYQSQGGVLSPLIIKPPSGWKRESDLVREPVHVMDVMPTVIDVANAKHPSESSGKLLMQGVSLLPLIKGDPAPQFRDRGFGGELFGIRSYRFQRWKILLLPPPYGTGEWELFDVDADPGETTDLAKSNPEKLEALISMWVDYAKGNGVVEPNRPIAYAKPPVR